MTKLERAISALLNHGFPVGDVAELLKIKPHEVLRMIEPQTDKFDDEDLNAFPKKRWHG